MQEFIVNKPDILYNILDGPQSVSQTLTGNVYNIIYMGSWKQYHYTCHANISQSNNLKLFANTYNIKTKLLVGDHVHVQNIRDIGVFPPHGNILFIITMPEKLKASRNWV